MESRDVKTLLLLEAIDKKDCQSQRELSERVNISLGLVNKFIQNLKNEGIFQITNLPNKKVKYIITPEGFIEKTDLTIQYLSHSIDHYNELKQRISDVLKALKQDKKRNLVLYGASELCEISCVLLSSERYFKIEILDDHIAGKNICGNTVRKFKDISSIDYDAVIIMDLENIFRTHEMLMGIGVSKDKIHSIFPFNGSI